MLFERHFAGAIMLDMDGKIGVVGPGCVRGYDCGQAAILCKTSSPENVQL